MIFRDGLHRQVFHEAAERKEQAPPMLLAARYLFRTNAIEKKLEKVGTK